MTLLDGSALSHDDLFEMWSIGAIAARLVTDGSAANPRQMVFASVPAEELDRELAPGDVVTPYDSLLIRTQKGTVLVDVGMGEHAVGFGAPAGRLLDSLSALGVAPEAVDIVVVTHGHPDHIGGLTAGGVPRFPRARHVIWRGEWEFWTSESGLASVMDPMAVVARAQLPPVEGLVEAIDEETEILPGVRLMPAPGHTPGHLVVEIEDAGESLLYLADAVLHELNFPHPEWVAMIDMDPQRAVETRRRLLDRAADRGSVIAAFHLGASGRVERARHAYRLVR